MIKRSIDIGAGVWLLWLLVPLTAPAGVVPAQRTGQWVAGTHVGVEGGIPNSSNMVVYTTIAVGASASTINSAISACPSNQVVQLSAGTYSISSVINLSTSGVVLRGAGRTNTILNFSGSAGIQCVGANIWGVADTGTVNGSANWTGGYSQGASNIVLSSVSGLSVGQIICLDQLNDNVDVSTTSYEGVSNAGRNNNRSQQHFCNVTAINGTTVTIWPPLAAPNWQSAMTPQAWWITGWLQQVGIESLTVNGNSSAGIAPDYCNIYLYGTANCWVKDVRSQYPTEAHINPYGTYRNEIRHCTFEGTQAAAELSYGIATFWSSFLLVEDNIFNGVAGSMMSGQCEMSSVWAYNYDTNNWYTVTANWNMPTHWYHDAGACMILGEGNCGIGTIADWIHGTVCWSLDFRNCWSGWQPYSYGGGQTTAQNVPIEIIKSNHWMAAVGNILGTSGKQTGYTLGPTSDHGTAIYNLGVYNSGYGDTAGDIVSSNTFFRDVNFDTVNNAIIYNATNSTHDLPNSLVHASKPAWFGNLTWPPFNPTNVSAAAVSPTNIPAGYRFVFGMDPPSGAPVNQPPVAIASVIPTNGVAPLAVTFSSAGSYDPEGTTLTYSWTFGDGSTSTNANPNHTYQTTGVYSAQLTVSDGTNTTASGILTITVTAAGIYQPPVAAASASPMSGIVPLAVTFSSAGSSDPEGTALTYSWTFGDGSTSTAANPSHTYQASAIYTAQLTVSDGTNQVSASPITITVGNGASGLVAAYGFEEGTGSTLTDASGNGNAGTVNGATWTTAGRYGNALSFNGTNSMVTANDSASLDLTAGMTLEAWVYPTALGSSWSDIIYKTTDIYFLMGTTPQGQLPDVGGSFASTNAYGVASLPLNTWSHLAGTYNGTNLQFYVNGVQVASRAQAGAIATSTGALSIGGDSTSGQFWTGMIDEVRIYNRALNSTEIQTDMNTPVIGSTGARPSPPPPPQNLRVLSQ
jgi:PKD repeat protein